MIPSPNQSNIGSISAALDSSTDVERREWLGSLKKKELSRLFELAEGTTLSLESIHGAVGDRVIHVGKNTLPVFSHFEKRICLHEGTVQGYNHQSLKWLVGAGHFRVVPHEVPGELLFDYLWEPQTVPDGFPVAQSNRRGLSILVYGNLQDVVRKVSEHVSIGRTLMKGKPTNNYFGLCRTSESS